MIRTKFLIIPTSTIKVILLQLNLFHKFDAHDKIIRIKKSHKIPLEFESPDPSFLKYLSSKQK